MRRVGSPQCGQRATRGWIQRGYDGLISPFLLKGPVGLGSLPALGVVSPFRR